MFSPPKNPDWRLSDFDFRLPEERIADRPASPRDSARLLHVRGRVLSDRHVFDLPELLLPGDVLVMNDTKVVPARLFGLRGAVKIEVLLNKPEIFSKKENKWDPRLRGDDGNLKNIVMPAQAGIPFSFSSQESIWSALARPGKRLHVGDMVEFAPDFACEIMEKREGGEILIRFNVPQEKLFTLLKQHGHIPLPPYISRPDTEKDRSDYQTVYAEKEGAVAAPTAGLHFTPELLAKLDSKGIKRETLTLHVGAGTFLPVKTERVADHIMHAEMGEIAPETAEHLNAVKKEGRRIVAVGTTSLRLLESASDENGLIRPFSAETDIFITPGYRFRAVDALMTNFHLPKSTLFMLVCALAGRENMRNAYAHAIAEQYRFYSYGDSSLLEKEI